MSGVVACSYRIMTTKSMRPPPRRTPWPNPIPTTTGSRSSNNNNNNTGLISKTSKTNNLHTNNNNINKNNKRKEERNDGLLQKPKTPITIKNPNPNPNPMTRLPKYDQIMRNGKQIEEKAHKEKKKKEKRKRKKERKKEEEGYEKNREVMAGYLAHEYLTKGTILGKMWDQMAGQKKTVEAQHSEKYERYVELAGLLKIDGAHIPGVVNPTQLAHHLRLMN